jgi:hypothetical protein
MQRAARVEAATGVNLSAKMRLMLQRYAPDAAVHSAVTTQGADC